MPFLQARRFRSRTHAGVQADLRHIKAYICGYNVGLAPREKTKREHTYARDTRVRISEAGPSAFGQHRGRQVHVAKAHQHLEPSKYCLDNWWVIYSRRSLISRVPVSAVLH